MPVDSVDVQIRNLVTSTPGSDQALHDAAKADEADAQANKKIQQRLVQKRSESQRIDSQRDVREQHVHQHYALVRDGGLSPQAQAGVLAWENNAKMQAMLTSAQRELFMQTLAENTARATDAAFVLQDMAAMPEFDQAITHPKPMAELYAMVVREPKTKNNAQRLLQSRYLRSPADPNNKAAFLRLGLDPKAQPKTLRANMGMMDAMADAKTSRPAEESALLMARRQGDNTQPMENVAQFVQRPSIRDLPQPARAKATELLAKTNGDEQVMDGFDTLASDQKFRAQSAAIKGRFYATIGSGRPSEYRPITDTLLTSLRHKDFPKRSGQVSKFLSRAGAMFQTGGVGNFNPDDAIRQARRSPIAAPELVATDALAPEETEKAHMQNRAIILRYFNNVEKHYAQAENDLRSSHTAEEAQRLRYLRPAARIDMAQLTPEDHALVTEKFAALDAKLEDLQKIQHQKLRLRREKPSERRKRAAARRERALQPRYFQPSQALREMYAVGGSGSVSNQPLGPRGGMAMRWANTPTSSIDRQVAHAVQQLGDGPMTPQRASQMAHTIAQTVAKQVAQAVTSQLLSSSNQQAGVSVPTPLSQEPGSSATKPQATSFTDAWGIKRQVLTEGLVADTVVKPANTNTDTTPPQTPATEKYSGRMLVNPAVAATMPTFFEIYGSNTRWVELSRPVYAMLQNLGWDQAHWDNRHDTENPENIRWPSTMNLAFNQLKPFQKDAAFNLGFSEQNWAGGKDRQEDGTLKVTPTTSKRNT